MSASAGGCVYCGLPRARVRTRAGGLRELVTCRAHVDLVAGDPAYSLAGHLAAVSYPALALQERAELGRREGAP